MPVVRSSPAPTTIRPLTTDDAAAYRALRKKILAIGDGRYFSDSYEREERLSESQWRDWCTETPEHCIFGVFHRHHLIGVMMVTRQGAAEDRTVEWEAIWLDPRYRRQGIARRAYEQVERWTLDHGYDRVALYIRADNQRSLDIHRRQGACYIYTKPGEMWADGSIGDTHAFVLDLQASTPERRYQKTLNHLDDVLAFLARGAHAPPLPQEQAPTAPAHVRPGLHERRFG
jgi:RimJ/RimL family protein N-acetyltransferase